MATRIIHESLCALLVAFCMVPCVCIAQVVRVRPDCPEALAAIPHEVAKALRAHPAERVIVRFAAGDYWLPPHALSFANQKGPFSLVAEDGASVRLIGGARVANWVQTNFNGCLVWSADVSHIPLKRRPDLFFCAGKTMIMARTPDFDPTNPYAGGWRYAAGELFSMYKDVPGESRQVLHVKRTDWRAHASPAEGRVFTFPRYNWQSSVCAVTNEVEADCTMHVSQPFFFASRPGDRYYLTGFREDLTSPGEWYCNYDARRIYFIPPAEVANPNEVPCALATDDAVIAFWNVTDATVSGLELMNASCGIRLDKCRRVRVEGCAIHDVGYYNGSGVQGSQCRECVVVDCDIWNTGAHGVFLAAAEAQDLTRCANRIENCYIHHTGWVNKHGVGIMVYGQGAVIEHNLIHDTPRNAIFHGSRLHTIRFNRIRHTNLEMEDSGAIYGGGYLGLQGTCIAYNWISDSIGFGHDAKGRYHHFHTTHGIYLDEAGGEALVVGNVVERSHTAAMHLHNARFNVISNNLFISNGTDKQFNMSGWNDATNGYFVRVRQPVIVKEYRRLIAKNPSLTNFVSLAVEPSGRNPFLSDGLMMQGNRVTCNIFYYPDQANSQALRVALFNTNANHFACNLYWPGTNAVTVGWGWRETYPFAKWRQMGEDGTSVIADPLLVNPAQGDFTVANDSPALKLGFQQIPFREIGLRPSPGRKIFPVIEAQGVREHPEWLKPPPRKK